MLYIVPSRGRPENIRELIESFSDTRTYVKLWICVDHDDPQLDRYQQLKLPSWAMLWTAPRMRLGPTLNHYASERLMDSEHCRGNELIGFMGDDHRPRTKGWDEVMGNAADDAGRTAVIYGNDLLQGAMLPTAVCMTANVLSALGYFCPPGMTHLYLDNAWKAIGESLGSLIYLQDVIIEHMHPSADKGQWDAGYIEVNSNEMWDADGEAYKRWMSDSSWRDKLHRLRGVKMMGSA